MSLRIHGTRDTFHGAGHPHQRARQGVPPRRVAVVITFAQASQSHSETIRTHGAVSPCQLTIYACDADGPRTKVITATRAADMREEGAQRRDARRVSGRWSSRWLTSESEDSKLHTMTTHAYSRKTRSHILFAIANMMIALDMRHHKDCISRSAFERMRH